MKKMKTLLFCSMIALFATCAFSIKAASKEAKLFDGNTDDLASMEVSARWLIDHGGCTVLQSSEAVSSLSVNNGSKCWIKHQIGISAFNFDKSTESSSRPLKLGGAGIVPFMPSYTSPYTPSYIISEKLDSSQTDVKFFPTYLSKIGVPGLVGKVKQKVWWKEVYWCNGVSDAGARNFVDVRPDNWIAGEGGSARQKVASSCKHYGFYWVEEKDLKHAYKNAQFKVHIEDSGKPTRKALFEEWSTRNK